MVSVLDGARSVASKQRSVNLPEELFRLSEVFEARSGANFNRQVLAALLQFYFDRPDGPDPYWMERAVHYQRGELDLSAIPSERGATMTAEAFSIVQLEDPEAAAQGKDPIKVKEYPSYAHAALVRRQCILWRKMLSWPGADAVSKITGFWVDANRPAAE